MNADFIRLWAATTISVFGTLILGMVFAVGGISSLTAAIAAGRAGRGFGAGPTMVAGVVIMGCSMFLVPLARDAATLALALLVLQQLGDGGFAVYDITQVSLRQAIAPARMLGRVNGSMRFSALGAMLVGSLAGGVLGETIGLRLTLTTAAAGVLLSTVWLVGSPTRTLSQPSLEAS